MFSFSPFWKCGGGIALPYPLNEASLSLGSQRKVGESDPCHFDPMRQSITCHIFLLPVTAAVTIPHGGYSISCGP